MRAVGRTVVPALAAAAALATGCGGGAGEERMSRSEYLRAGAAICSDYSSRIDRLGAPRELDEIGPYLAKALPVLDRTVRRLAALRPPEALADDFDAYLEAARATRNRAFALRDAASRADGGAVQRLLAEAQRASRRTDLLATAAGLDACARA